MRAPTLRWTTVAGLAFLLAVWVALLDTAGAQVVVRQGTNDDLVFKEFNSPVTVEASLREFVDSAPDETWTVPPLGNFYCDGVTIESVTLEKRLKKSVNRTRHAIAVSIDLHTRKQENDMSVNVEFSLVNGERRLFLGTMNDLQVNADEDESEGETYSVSAEDFETYLAAGTSSVLRVSMTTRPK